MIWEYNTRRVTDERLDETLALEGSDGWELVAIDDSMVLPDGVTMESATDEDKEEAELGYLLIFKKPRV